MLLLVIGFAIVAIVWWADAGWRPRPMPGVDRDRPWFLGHRGARSVHPDNTAPAFEVAFERLDGIETDVQRTADGELVLLHDLEVGSLLVAEADIVRLRDRVPGLATLDELFEIAERYPGRLLNLEVKTSGRILRPPSLERNLVRAVRSAGLADRVLVSSFDPLALARVRLLAPRLRTALLTAPDAPRFLRSGALARWLHVDALHPHHEQVDPALLARCRDRQLPVHVWTVNDRDAARSLLDAGASALIGDDPDVFAHLGREHLS